MYFTIRFHVWYTIMRKFSKMLTFFFLTFIMNIIQFNSIQQNKLNDAVYDFFLCIKLDYLKLFTRERGGGGGDNLNDCIDN